MFFTILLLILFLVLLLPTLILSLIARILSIFKFRDKGNHVHPRGGQHETKIYDTGGDTDNRKNGKKIFEKNEGEYVDFEEIK